jgi:PAS domain S-box-containing protein
MASGTSTPSTRPRILFVEDDSAVRGHIATMLADEFVIDTAGDGIDALKVLLRLRPDVVATDIVMPELNGIEFLKTLRATPSMRLIPVLLISGHAPEELRVEGFEQGADGYLAKPYTERELRARLRTMVKTARDRVEAARLEALQQAEREAMGERASLLESITDPFYALDRQFCFTYVNGRALEYFQQPRSQLLGNNIWSLYPQAVGSQFETEYRRALMHHRPCEFEALSPISNRWIEVHVYPTPRGLAINFRDITARKETERALRESEAARNDSEARQRATALRDAVRVQLVDALRPLRDPVEIEATATRILGEHLGALRVLYFAVSADESWATVEANYVARGPGVLGTHRLDDFGPPLMQQVRKGVPLAVNDVAGDERLDSTSRKNTLGLGIAAHVLAPVMHEHRLVAALAVHHSQPHAWSPEVVAFIQEFAERICAALERIHSEIEIREANRRKDEFLATLAHELRNPLAPMRSAVHVLKNPALTSDQSRQAREIIERQIHHMIRLVDDLLDVSRISVGHINLRNERVSLNTLITDALEATRSVIDESRHVLEVQLPQQTVLLEGDATRLVQVFQNLLNNAAKYTPAGGRIHIGGEIRGSEIVVTVRDNGLGIAADSQERIFELFTRVHPRDSIKVSGLGIGLSLARTLVELHNGRLEVHSEGLNQGSEFRVYLPVAEPIEEALPVDSRTMSKADCAHRVLVVDDNRDAAESLAMLLSGDGFETRVAFDGPRALEEFGRYGPDIILLDIGMPLMDGYEVARRIRSSPGGSNVLLCALTGWGQLKDKQLAIDAGFDEHITKPVEPSRLIELMVSSLAGKS